MRKETQSERCSQIHRMSFDTLDRRNVLGSVLFDVLIGEDYATSMRPSGRLEARERRSAGGRPSKSRHSRSLIEDGTWSPWSSRPLPNLAISSYNTASDLIILAAAALLGRNWAARLADHLRFHLRHLQLKYVVERFVSDPLTKDVKLNAREELPRVRSPVLPRVRFQGQGWFSSI